ncbi:sulfite exporter TauE/SafE family protein [Ellagibacter isourolithinifaciens]|uniref:sulfite exporter TauE/SafE family protein n=1 Tax=Ellagibacter isourolithinifaciens TaxID=2137581 RepID=UPI003AAAAE98
MMVEVLVHFVAPALVGVLIGIASGLLGIGGGTVMVPIFRLAFGMSATMSTATSLFAIIPTSISGAISHVKGKTCIPALGIAAGLGGACMSPIGVWLAQLSPDWLVMLAAALIIGYSAINMFKKAFKIPQAGQPATGVDAAAAASLTSSGEPAVSAPTADDSSLSRKQLLQGAAIGLVAGLASGYVGVGGGFIMVPLMLSIIGIPMRKASGTSLIAVMILAIPGVIEQGIIGNINYLAGIAIVIGTIPGAVIGARLVTKVPERTLRLLFGCFLIVAAVMLVLNEVGIFG